MPSSRPSITPSDIDASFVSTLPHRNFSREYINYNIPSLQYEKWKDGIFDFYRQIYPSFCCVCLAPCIHIGQLCEKLHISSCIFIFICCIILLLLFGAAIYVTRMYYVLCGLWIFLFATAFYLRRKTQSVLNIDGNICCDILLAFILPHLVLAQVSRQLYGYQRCCDCHKFSFDGTPSWQRSPSVNCQVPVLQYQGNTIGVEYFKPSSAHKVFVQPASDNSNKATEETEHFVNLPRYLPQV